MVMDKVRAMYLEVGSVSFTADLDPFSSESGPGSGQISRGSHETELHAPSTMGFRHFVRCDSVFVFS